MSTCRDLIEETKRHLFAGTRERMNALATGMDASTADVSLSHSINFTEGAVLAIDLELVYVWATSVSGATVSRGWLGSTAATHSSGAIVTVNPRFSDFSIFTALNADLADLSSPFNGLYQMKGTSVTYSAGVGGYDLTGITDILDIYDVRYEETGITNVWPDVTHWRLKRISDTGDYPSGNALIVYSGAQPGNPIRVVYRAPFAALTTTTDDVQTVAGLPASADDLPPLGAAMRLAGVREVMRNLNESQGETRRADETPPGSQRNAGIAIREIREQRVRAERERLERLYPPKRLVW